MDFLFDEKIPASTIEITRNDMRVLHGLKIQSREARDTQLFGVPEVTTQSLEAWMGERLKVAIDYPKSALILLTRLETSRLFQSYPNVRKAFRSHDPYGPRLPPPPADPSAPPSSRPTTQPKLRNDIAPESTTVMAANMGAAAYIAGKSLRVLYSYKMSDGRRIPIFSPRVGIFALHKNLEGVFDERSARSTAASLLRLLFLFHEARHSDGNGHSLLFGHAACPRGHDYQGTASCDANANGPYTVGARAFILMLRACTQCSVAELEALRLPFIDLSSRIVGNDGWAFDGSNPAPVWDATPEQIENPLGRRRVKPIDAKVSAAIPAKQNAR